MKKTKTTGMPSHQGQPRRLNIRLSEEDHTQLRELRDLLGQSGDSATIRCLIRIHHATAKAELARLRRARRSRG
jgi:DNA-directed RNA polymerase subunit L